MTCTCIGVKTHGHVLGNRDTRTHGGYTGSHVCHERFIVKIPVGMDIKKAAPILGAGITLWGPMRHMGLAKEGDGKKVVGIAGIGGIGIMGIELAAALGHTVVAISGSKKKEAMAKQKGASDFVVSTDSQSLKNYTGNIDFILNTVSADHDLTVYLPLLATNGTIIQLGGAAASYKVSEMFLIFKRKSIAGSLIGGIAATQEVVCCTKEIYQDIRMITASGLNDAWKDLDSNVDDGVRYVVDIKASLDDATFMPVE